MKRTHTSDIGLAKMMSDPECAMHNPENQSFFIKFRKQGQEVQKKNDTLEDVLWTDDEGPLSIPEHGTALASESLSQSLNRPQLRAQIRVIAQKVARRIYVIEMYKAFFKTAKDSLSDVFQIGFESVNDGL